MTELLGRGQRFLAPLLGLVGIAQLPEWSENPRIACNSGVKSAGEEQGGGRRVGSALQTLLEVGPGRDEVAEVERVAAHNHMARLHEDRIRLALSQGQELRPNASPVRKRPCPL